MKIAKYIFIIFLFICIISLNNTGCVKNNKITVSEGVVMLKELSYEEAQQLAIKLANEAFAKKEFKNPYTDTGSSIPTVKFDYIAGTKEDNKWMFQKAGPAGPWATISFDIDGSNQKVEVGYSWQ